MWPPSASCSASRRVAAGGRACDDGLMQRIAVVLVAAVSAVMLFGSEHAQATWSIVGVDEETGEVGVAVASCVGSEVTVVPVLVPGVGAAASQANLSSASGDRLVMALESGQDAQGAIDAIPDVRSILVRLNVNITGSVFDRGQQ